MCRAITRPPSAPRSPSRALAACAVARAGARGAGEGRVSHTEVLPVRRDEAREDDLVQHLGAVAGRVHGVVADFEREAGDVEPVAAAIAAQRIGRVLRPRAAADAKGRGVVRRDGLHDGIAGLVALHDVHRVGDA